MREHFYYFIDQVTDSKFLKPKKAVSTNLKTYATVFWSPFFVLALPTVS